MRKMFRSPLLAIGLILVSATTVFATAGLGFHPTAPFFGTLSRPLHAHADGIELSARGQVDFVRQTIVIDPGATSGWHHHPGIVLVTVTTGTMTGYDRHCNQTVYPAGTSFVESGTKPGLFRNEGADPAGVTVTFIVPTGTASTGLRIDDANPGCTES